MRSKKVWLIVALACVGWVALASIAEAKTLRIATNTPYEPMEYLQADGTIAGFDIDFGNAICAELGYTCEWSDQEWNGLIPGLNAHRYDAIMATMTITEKRAKQVLFSKPYIVIPSGFFVREDSSIREINDEVLEGKSIGVQRGTVQDEYVTDTYGNIATIKRYRNADDAQIDLQTGRLDAMFAVEITGMSALIDAYPDQYRQVGPHITKPAKYFGSGFGVALRKGDKTLADKVNKAIDTLHANGTYDELYKKYFHGHPQVVDE